MHTQTDQSAAPVRSGGRARTFSASFVEREFTETQRITTAYLGCVNGGAGAKTCATQADPNYAGFAENQHPFIIPFNALILYQFNVNTTHVTRNVFVDLV
ncbi:MAG: hypothetical protein MI924_07105 [Chloroflexales bacterium]|nr:hypothetical protein [Chloroflexales bacterium]